MATWQYTIELIPREKLVNLFGAVPRSLNEETYEAAEWWGDRQPSGNYETLIASFIPPRPSWSEDVKCWGEEDGNRISAVLKGKCVVEMSVRFDLRNPDEEFMRNVVDLARRSDCVFLGEDMELIEPSVDELESRLASSDAARFVRDPTLYLEEVERSRRILRTA